MILRTVVLNPKGGSGKTMVACNLLSAFAHDRRVAALIDQDRQGSAGHWLKQRPASLPTIHGVAAYEEPPASVTRSFAMRLPPDTERVVVDTAAALDRHQLIDAVRRADKILVPVLASDLDIHAATRCISDLLVHAKVAREVPRLAVVANRVKRNTVMYRSLMRFLDNLGVPVVAVLRDAQVYVRAAEEGQGICEFGAPDTEAEIAQWRGLVRWIDHDELPCPEASPQPEQAPAPAVGHLSLIRR